MSALIIILLLLDASINGYVSPRWTYQHRRSFVLLERRKKKNKYAKFSKTDKIKIDPFEIMLEQAEEKKELLKKEKDIRENKVVKEIDPNEKRERNEIIFGDARKIDPYDPSTYGYTELGTILGAHGVKGEVKVASVTDFPERLCREGQRHIKRPFRRSPRRIYLLGGRQSKDEEYLVSLEGIGDRDAAKKLRGCVLYAREDEVSESLEQDEFLVSDLVGLEVFLQQGYVDENGKDKGKNFVGIVNGIVLAEEMGSTPSLGQDLIEIKLPRGPGATMSWNDELVLIPFVPQLVPDVNVTEGAIYINPPFGLLDLTYVREEKFRIKGLIGPCP